MNGKKSYITKIIILIVIVVIAVFAHIYLIDMERLFHDEDVLFSTWGQGSVGIIPMEDGDDIVTEKRACTIIENLEKEDTTGEYNYYVVKNIDEDNPVVVKIDKKYELQANTNYEFEFSGPKKAYYLNNDDMRYIFELCEIINIKQL